jgi:zinc transport system substrate-binding protein
MFSSGHVDMIQVEWRMRKDEEAISRIGFIIVAVLVLGGFSIGALLLSNPTEQDTAKLGVVVTIPPQVEFVERLGGEQVKVTLMVPPGKSPHTYEPTHSQMQEVSVADMYFKVGSGVEFEEMWLDEILGMNPGIRVVDSSVGVSIMGSDPHIWLSPLNAKVMVSNLCQGLKSLDPVNSTEYDERATTYLNELDDLDEYIRNEFANATTRKFMVYHPSWGYYASEYGLEQMPIEEEGKEPTLQGINNLIQQAQENNITAIFVSPQFDTDSAETIADQIDGEVIFVDPLPQYYLDNLRDVTDELRRAFVD